MRKSGEEDIINFLLKIFTIATNIFSIEGFFKKKFWRQKVFKTSGFPLFCAYITLQKWHLIEILKEWTFFFCFSWCMGCDRLPSSLSPYWKYFKLALLIAPYEDYQSNFTNGSNNEGRRFFYKKKRKKN